MWVNWGISHEMDQIIIIDDVVVAKNNVDVFRIGFVVLVVEALLACGVGPQNVYKCLNWEKCMIRCVYP